MSADREGEEHWYRSRWKYLVPLDEKSNNYYQPGQWAPHIGSQLFEQFMLFGGYFDE